MRIDLGNGDWAEVLEVDDLRDGDRKAVNRVIRIQADENDRPILPGNYRDDMEDALLVRVCHAWSLNFPPPTADPKSLDKMTIAQSRALRKGISEHMSIVREDDESDPKSEQNS